MQGSPARDLGTRLVQPREESERLDSFAVQPQGFEAIAAGVEVQKGEGKAQGHPVQANHMVEEQAGGSAQVAEQVQALEECLDVALVIEAQGRYPGIGLARCVGVGRGLDQGSAPAR